jgi:hypothetical protein
VHDQLHAVNRQHYPVTAGGISPCQSRLSLQSPA